MVTHTHQNTRTRPRKTRPRGAAWPHLLALTATAACVSYAADPLEPVAILAEVDAARSRPEGAPAPTLAEVVESMRQHNARIVNARAAHAAAQATADVATPLPNPTIAAGPVLNSGPGILDSTRWGAEAALGWALPISGRLGIRDDLNAARADAAWVRATSAERGEYLGLRRAIAVGVLRAARATALDAQTRTFDALLRQQERLIAAGRSSATDLRASDLLRHGSRATLLAGQADVAAAHGDLSVRSGLAPGAFEGLDRDHLPPLPSEIPELDTLGKLLPAAPQLATLAADYLVAEEQLRLQIARQWPDLTLGPSYEHEQGIDRWGLSVGVTVPLFNRNQQAIASAQALREATRGRYRAAARQRLNDVEAARAVLIARMKHLDYVRTEVLPAATELATDAREAAEAGAINAFELLQLLRGEAQARLQAVTTEQAAYDAWFDLETACGAPLLLFPDEPTTGTDPVTDDRSER